MDDRSRKAEKETMDKEYLTVKEFAAAAGVSTQRIYQRLAKDLQSDLPSTCKEETRGEIVSLLQSTLDLLQQQLTVMDEQLKTKDKQMSELQRQIEQLTVALTSSQQQNRELTETLKDTTDKLTTALSQQQALHAGTIQQQLEQHEPDSELDLPTAPEDQEEQPAPKQEKVSLFKRLFGKRK